MLVLTTLKSLFVMSKPSVGSMVSDSSDGVSELVPASLFLLQATKSAEDNTMSATIRIAKTKNFFLFIPNLYKIYFAICCP